MSQMSYCQFENTYNDLKQCGDALEAGEPLSPEELRYAKRLVRLCEQIANEFDADHLANNAENSR